MTVTAHIRGRLVTWDPDAGIYRWDDTRQPAAGWGGDERPCPTCHLTADPDDGAGGADPCLGVLPDCETACCGHGTHDGWISRPRANIALRVNVAIVHGQRLKPQTHVRSAPANTPPATPDNC